MKVRILLGGLVAVAAVLAIVTVGQAQRPAAFDLKFGSLAGTKELGGVGDPDAVGTASGTLVEPDTLCYSLTVKNTDQPVAAHIHRGRKHENGPVVIPLTPPDAGDPGTSAGCVSGISPELMQDLRVRPDRYYWNVHTEAHRPGALRGQVFNAR